MRMLLLSDLVIGVFVYILSAASTAPSCRLVMAGAVFVSPVYVLMNVYLYTPQSAFSSPVSGMSLVGYRTWVMPTSSENHDTCSGLDAYLLKVGDTFAPQHVFSW